MKDLDSHRLERLTRLKDRLSLAPHKTHELLSWQGHALDDRVARRTLERDLETLKQMEPTFRRIRRGEYHIPPRSTHTLHPLEALSLYSVMRLFYHHAPTGAGEYRRVLERLTKQLPTHIQPLALRSLVEVEAAQSSDAPLELAMQAWSEGRCLRFEYLKSDNSGREDRKDDWETYTLKIHFIEISRTNLSPYLIGNVLERNNDTRTFKLALERIRNVKVLDEGYEIPSSFDPRAFLSNAWGVLGRNKDALPPVKVRLRFESEVTYLIKEGRFPGLTYQRDHKAGPLEAEVMVAVDKQNFPREILPWVLSFGRKVRVLEPENLRLRVLDEARAVLEGRV